MHQADALFSKRHLSFLYAAFVQLSNKSTKKMSSPAQG